MRSSTASANLLFVLIASMFAISTVSGQTAPPGRFPEPLEKYLMAPAPRFYRLETSPRMISRFGPFVSYQANVDAQGNIYVTGTALGDVFGGMGAAAPANSNLNVFLLVFQP